MRHIRLIHKKMFCLDKIQIKRIKVEFNDFGLPFICFIVQRYKRHYLILCLDPADYYPYYCKKILICDTLDMDPIEAQCRYRRLKPKVLQIRKDYVIIRLRDKICKVRIKQ